MEQGDAGSETVFQPGKCNRDTLPLVVTVADEKSERFRFFLEFGKQVLDPDMSPDLHFSSIPFAASDRRMAVRFADAPLIL